MNKIYIGIGLVVALFASVYGIYHLGYSNASQEYETAIDKANAVQKARLDELTRQNEIKLNELSTQLKQKQEEYTASVTELNTELDSLHKSIRSNQYRASENTATSNLINETSPSVWDVLEQCTTEYSKMGQSAEQQLIQLKAWQDYGKIIQSMKDQDDN